MQGNNLTVDIDGHAVSNLLEFNISGFVTAEVSESKP